MIYMSADSSYWVTKKLPQICTVILHILIGKVALFSVYTCGNFWVTQYFEFHSFEQFPFVNREAASIMHCVGPTVASAEHFRL